MKRLFFGMLSAFLTFNNTYSQDSIKGYFYNNEDSLSLLITNDNDVICKILQSYYDSHHKYNHYLVEKVKKRDSVICINNTPEYGILRQAFLYKPDRVILSDKSIYIDNYNQVNLTVLPPNDSIILTYDKSKLIEMVGKRNLNKSKYIEFTFAYYYYTFYIDLEGSSITEKFKELYQLELQNYEDIKILIPSRYLFSTGIESISPK